jgi:hypothetical protein
MTCQRSGCPNPTKGPRARFCSGACKVAAHRQKPLKGKVVAWSGKKVAAEPALFEQSADPKDAHHPRCDRSKCGLTPEECRKMPDPPPISDRALEPASTFEKPCSEGGIKHGGPGCTHGTFRNVLSDPMGLNKPFKREHADGCPCWTCKGVPDKKPAKPKKP